MSRFVLISDVLLAAWPGLIWLTVVTEQAFWTLPLMGLVLVMRLWVLWRSAFPWRGLAMAVASVAVILIVFSVLLRSLGFLLYYPVLINFMLLVLFAGSLWTEAPIIERIARFRTPDLPPEAVRYTCRVTWVWMFFFALNGLVALHSCLAGDLNWWALWNGGIAYGAMGLLMACEYCVRRRVMRSIGA
jgi:uncharacterized membrane protein